VTTQADLQVEQHVQAQGEAQSKIPGPDHPISVRFVNSGPMSSSRSQACLIADTREALTAQRGPLFPAVELSSRARMSIFGRAGPGRTASTYLPLIRGDDQGYFRPHLAGAKRSIDASLGL